jgi:hypothetical protein
MKRSGTMGGTDALDDILNYLQDPLNGTFEDDSSQSSPRRTPIISANVTTAGSSTGSSRPMSTNVMGDNYLEILNDIINSQDPAFVTSSRPQSIIQTTQSGAASKRASVVRERERRQRERGETEEERKKERGDERCHSERDERDERDERERENKGERNQGRKSGD